MLYYKERFHRSVALFLLFLSSNNYSGSIMNKLTLTFDNFSVGRKREQKNKKGREKLTNLFIYNDSIQASDRQIISQKTTHTK